MHLVSHGDIAIGSGTDSKLLEASIGSSDEVSLTLEEELASQVTRPYSQM
jgi:hypothetical protein